MTSNLSIAIHRVNIQSAILLININFFSIKEFLSDNIREDEFLIRSFHLLKRIPPRWIFHCLSVPRPYFACWLLSSLLPHKLIHELDLIFIFSCVITLKNFIWKWKALLIVWYCQKRIAFHLILWYCQKLIVFNLNII